MPVHRSSVQTEEMQEKEQACAEMLQTLLKRQAFPFPYEQGEDPLLIQTHASAVILTPEYVYTLKKPRNFGFFDSSTTEARRHFCQMEVILNDPLAPDIYLGVAPVITSSGGNSVFGSTSPPGSVPFPGTVSGNGMIVDYAVVMRRLPERATLSSLLQAGNVTPELIAEIAQVIAMFHTSTPTDEYIAQAGCLEVIRQHWEEHFHQIRPSIGRTIERKTYSLLQHAVSQFLHHHRPLFRQRCLQGHIRDCHGDLRLQHIYVLPDETTSTLRRILLLDRIEFNERFRSGDVASEVAFLCMEFDHAQRPDLSQIFLTQYRAETGDTSLPELLPFYACYRACVRGKVTSFLLDDPEVSTAQREQAVLEASDLFPLALHSTRISQQPLLLLVGGVMGTGKSTIAQELQRACQCPLLSTDTIRKHLAHLDPTPPQAEPFGAGIYDPSWTQKTYTALNNRAQAYLQRGFSVIVDGTFARRADRQRVAQEAMHHGATVIFLECVTPREMALQRLTQRWQTGVNSPTTPPSSASDGRPELYDAQVARWEALDPAQESGIRHLMLSTAQAPQATMASLLQTLVPALARAKPHLESRSPSSNAVC